jgi:hypothetical protein
LHPHTFYATLFNQSKRDEVFVIMSFAPEFDARWQQVILPCIQDDLKLKANRVDYNTSGESVVHDILDGIAHARLIVADITSYRMMDDNGHFWPQRNANVMWELGLVHVMRMPDEVLVVRSDNDPSIFDLTQFRAFQYDPTQIVASRQLLAALAQDRLRSVDQIASDYVKRCADSLDDHTVMVLGIACNNGWVMQPEGKTIAQALGAMPTRSAISRLLEMGALSTEYIKVTAEFLARTDLDKATTEQLSRHCVTPLGLALMRHVATRMNLDNPELAPLFEQFQIRDKAPAGT